MERVNPGDPLAADWGTLEEVPGTEEAAPLGRGAERFCELG